MRLIGIEEHFITPAVRDAWDAIGLGARDPGAAFQGGDVGRRNPAILPRPSHGRC